MDPCIPCHVAPSVFKLTTGHWVLAMLPISLASAMSLPLQLQKVLGFLGFMSLDWVNLCNSGLSPYLKSVTLITSADVIVL